MSMSNASETALMNLLFNNVAYANLGDSSGVQPSVAAGSLFISLHSADPGEAGNQSTSEISYTGYARVGVARTPAGFSVSGALFGSNDDFAKEEYGPPKIKKELPRIPIHWHWTGDRYIHSTTEFAVKEAIQKNSKKPVIFVAGHKITIPTQPKGASLESYLVDSVKFADKKRDELKAQAEQDEIALILATLGLIESDQLVIV